MTKYGTGYTENKRKNVLRGADRRLRRSSNLQDLYNIFIDPLLNMKDEIGQNVPNWLDFLFNTKRRTITNFKTTKDITFKAEKLDLPGKGNYGEYMIDRNTIVTVRIDLDFKDAYDIETEYGDWYKLTEQEYIHKIETHLREI
jgi:hypothetical protein